ncbi:chaperone-binding protein [Fusarium subglutinans]|uniref:Chaperone-binding protein n=1 Tax=Gibberella subglutinans TaxID=42677 RepID=A0A8H5Q017_GIBSU|nr:chaperone-binding protein [Fusarium subglutinans]KAF5605774.1 chaperone-binding protein [Fusarium subglutinans]
MRFEIDPDIVPNLKLGLHSFQIIISLVAWCLQIGVFNAKDAEVTGRNGWAFAVCFLSVPAWIFLIMTPRWGRTRRFAQPHAMLAVDAAFTVIWLSAFATQAAYNAAGQCGKACGISKGVVGCGVLVTLLFAGSTFVSAFTLNYYNNHNILPGYDNRQMGSDNIDPDKAAFSMAPHGDEAYERVDMDDQEPSGSAYGGGYNNNSYNSHSRYGDANPYSADDEDPDRFGALPPRNNTFFDNDTEYHSGGAPPSMPASYANPTGGHPYEDVPAQFPAGNYDRGH